MSTPARSGFTRLEFTVGLVAVGLLTAIFVPWIQNARESARRSQCRVNLKLLALALSNYHDTHNVLPPAHIAEHGWGWGWGGMSLPLIDASPWYFLLSPNGPIALEGPANQDRRNILRQGFEVYQCPSESVEHTPGSTIKVPEKDGDGILEWRLEHGVNPKTAVETNIPGKRTPIGFSSYVGVIGDADAACPTEDGNGTMWHNSSVAMDDITDGAANTFLLGERDGRNHAGGNWAGTSYDVTDPGRCKDPHFVVTFCNEQRPLNGSDPFSFGSLHHGGALFVMADGAVQFIHDDIDIAVYRQLARRNDSDAEREAAVSEDALAPPSAPALLPADTR